MKDPAFMFYSSDFLTGTVLMSDEQVGKYIRLLCIQHQKGHLTEAQIYKICGGNFDPEIFEKFIQDKDGKYYNPRLQEEADKRARHREQQRENVMKRWNAKNTKHDTKPIPNVYHGITKGDTKTIPLENENENNKKEGKGIRERKEKKINIPFDDFWDLYGKKVGSKSKAERKWKSLSDGARKKVMDTLPGFLKTITDKQFQPYPLSYLNNERWEDDLRDLIPKPQKGHPDAYSASYEAKLNTEELQDYWRHLRNLGYQKIEGKWQMKKS